VQGHHGALAEANQQNAKIQAELRETNARLQVATDEMGKSLGLTQKQLDARADEIEGYGKGAIVGAAGELEHGALWHVPGGYAMREVLGWKGDAASYAKGQANGQSGNALAIVPSTKKVGPPGATLDVPLTHINASYVRSHFDAVEVRVPGAPHADEIVLILTMSTGPRVHARVGGLAASAIAKWDGQR
jgi:hypothetical protein